MDDTIVSEQDDVGASDSGDEVEEIIEETLFKKSAVREMVLHVASLEDGQSEEDSHSERLEEPLMTLVELSAVEAVSVFLFGEGAISIFAGMLAKSSAVRTQELVLTILANISCVKSIAQEMGTDALLSNITSLIILKSDDARVIAEGCRLLTSVVLRDLSKTWTQTFLSLNGLASIIQMVNNTLNASLLSALLALLQMLLGTQSDDCSFMSDADLTNLLSFCSSFLIDTLSTFSSAPPAPHAATDEHPTSPSPSLAATEARQRGEPWSTDLSSEQEASLMAVLDILARLGATVRGTRAVHAVEGLVPALQLMARSLPCSPALHDSVMATLDALEPAP